MDHQPEQLNSRTSKDSSSDSKEVRIQQTHNQQTHEDQPEQESFCRQLFGELIEGLLSEALLLIPLGVLGILGWLFISIGMFWLIAPLIIVAIFLFRKLYK